MASVRGGREFHLGLGLFFTVTHILFAPAPVAPERLEIDSMEESYAVCVPS